MTTVDTQPSISASSVSGRSSATVCSRVALGSNIPWERSSSIFDGSIRRRGDARGQLFHPAHVDLPHALGVGLDRAEQLTRQPRHVAEKNR